MGARKYQLERHWSEEDSCVVKDGKIKPTSLQLVEDQRCPLRGTNLYLLSQQQQVL